MANKKVYEIVTEKMIERLEKGDIPWRRPWVGEGAVSWAEQRPYRGINALLLEPGEYATFNQISKNGGKVKKGQKGHLVVFWKWIEIEEEDEETGETTKKNIPFLRYYKVFEINSQVEGLDSKRKEEKFEHDPIEQAEKVVELYSDKPPIKKAPGRAFYRPSSDEVSVPDIEDFPHPDEYYSVLFHELVHSTGHEDRLNRVGIKEASFGSEVYSKEELIAEIGAAMLCGVTGISNERNQENSAAYLRSWISKLKDDSRLIVQAAAQAQKAADWVQGQKGQ